MRRHDSNQNRCIFATMRDRLQNGSGLPSVGVASPTSSLRGIAKCLNAPIPAVFHGCAPWVAFSVARATPTDAGSQRKNPGSGPTGVRFDVILCFPARKFFMYDLQAIERPLVLKRDPPASASATDRAVLHEVPGCVENRCNYLNPTFAVVCWSPDCRRCRRFC